MALWWRIAVVGIKEVVRLAVESLLVQKLRTALTILGMVIGVGAIVLLVSLGQGAKNYVTSEFEGLGTNLIIIQPGKSDKKTHMGPPVGAAQRKMTTADVMAIEKRALNVEAVSGLVLGTVSARFEDALSNITVFGTNEQFPQILSVRVGRGNYFSREEDDYGRRVLVLGQTVATELFGEADPIGLTVKLNESEFRIIGVLLPMGNKLGLDFDELGFIPTEAALKLFNDDKLFGIRAKASSRVGIDDAVAEISEILKERRDGEEDFTVLTQVSMMESMNTILNMLTYVLAAIAAISMLVGGIGIMNIMWVTVVERTQEIGIRRAVGARRVDILKQLLAEAVALSVLGGAVGVGGAVVITLSLYFVFPSFDMRAPLWIIAPAFFVAFIVGVVFGVVPAWRASRIEILDALRYE
jgi:putative ABC transport system permease protein